MSCPQTAEIPNQPDGNSLGHDKNSKLPRQQLLPKNIQRDFKNFRHRIEVNFPLYSTLGKIQPFLWMQDRESLLKNLSLLAGGNKVEWEGMTFGRKEIQKLPIFFTKSHQYPLPSGMAEIQISSNCVVIM